MHSRCRKIRNVSSGGVTRANLPDGKGFAVVEDEVGAINRLAQKTAFELIRLVTGIYPAASSWHATVPVKYHGLVASASN